MGNSRFLPDEKPNTTIGQDSNSRHPGYWASLASKFHRLYSLGHSTGLMVCVSLISEINVHIPVGVLPAFPISLHSFIMSSGINSDAVLLKSSREHLSFLHPLMVSLWRSFCPIPFRKYISTKNLPKYKRHIKKFGVNERQRAHFR